MISVFLFCKKYNANDGNAEYLDVVKQEIRDQRVMRSAISNRGVGGNLFE